MFLAQLIWLSSKAKQEYIQQEYIDKPRARRYGGGRQAQLSSSADKLLLILVYFRLYPTQIVQGFLFEMGQTQACEWVHKLNRILNQALGYEFTHNIPSRGLTNQLKHHNLKQKALLKNNMSRKKFRGYSTGQTHKK